MNMKSLNAQSCASCAKAAKDLSGVLSQKIAKAGDSPGASMLRETRAKKYAAATTTNRYATMAAHDDGGGLGSLPD